MSNIRNNDAAAVSDADEPMSEEKERTAAKHSPRLVTTGENLIEKSPILTRENLLQTDRVQLLTTDGRHPKIVLHPIPLETVSPQVAHIDWFAFTLTPPQGEGVMWLVTQLSELFGIAAAMPTGKGWNGYKQRHTLTDGHNANYGLLAHGGESQRGSVHVELNAQACALVTDWGRVKVWGERYGVTITRLDLAHDDIEGKFVSIATALEWHQAGEFATNGRPPAASLIDDLGSGKGKTLYIGNRVNGKLCRVYEKGRQLGDTSSPWVRVEVEWRNKGRVIPLDALINPGHYLAGAYPCLSFLSVVQEKIRTITKTVTVTLNSAIHHAQQMAGKLVNVMMQSHGGDAFAVVNELKRDGVPRRLENYADFLPQVFAGGAP